MSSASSTLTSALSAEQLRHYTEQGYLVLRQRFTASEVAELADEADGLLRRQDLIRKTNLRCRYRPHFSTGELLFETFDPVLDLSPACARMAADPRILDVLEAIYGEPACLFKDKLIFKPPGVVGYPMHQDCGPEDVGWPVTLTAVLIAIDPGDRANGGMEVFPGYHTRGCLVKHLGEPGAYHRDMAGLVDESKAVWLDLEPGDVTVFGSLLPHRSGPNRSQRLRRHVFLSYNARSDGGDQRERHYASYFPWLAGWNAKVRDITGMSFQ